MTSLVSSADCTRQGPEAAVHRFVEAQKTHDVDRVLAQLSEDFVFRDRERTFAVTRTEIRPMLEWDAATGWRGDVTVLETAGDTVRTRLVETNDFLELLGLGPLEHEVVFVVSGGLVRESIMSPGADLQRAVDASIAPVVQWARERRPSRLDGLLHEGSVIYDGRSAAGWLELLREARNAGVTVGDSR